MIIGTGCDITKISRISRLLQGKHRDRFLLKAYHPLELIDCGRGSKLDVSPLDLDASKLAARWAAKEAVFKALGMENVPFHRIRIVRSKREAPGVEFDEEDLRRRIKSKVGEVQVFLSLSHDAEYAFATVVVQQVLGRPWKWLRSY